MKSWMTLLSLAVLVSAKDWNLDQVLVRAAEQNYALQVSKSKWAEALAKTDEANSALQPRAYVGARAAFLTVNPAANFPPMEKFPIASMTSDAFNSQDLRMGVRWPVLDLAQVSRYQSVKKYAQIQALDSSVQKDQLFQLCLVQFMQLAKTEAILKARKEEKKWADDLFSLTLQMRKAGTLTKVDEIRAQTMNLSADYNVEQVEFQLQKAQSDLAQALNESDAGAIHAVLDTTASSLENLKDSALLELALQSRPELNQLREQIHLNQDEVKSIGKESLPTLDLGADMGLSGRKLWDDGKPTWSTNLALNWNFWDGGRRHAREVQQKEKVKQLELLQLDLKRKLRTELDNAKIALKQSQMTLKMLAQKKQLAQMDLEASKDRFKTGAIGSFEVVQSQQSLALVDEQYVEALIGLQWARLNLKKITAQW